MIQWLRHQATNTGCLVRSLGNEILHATTKTHQSQINKTHNFKKESLKINNVEQDAFVKKKKVEERQYSPTYTPPPCPGGGLSEG